MTEDKADEERADRDFAAVRDNLQQLILKGTDALDQVGALAEQGQEARMFEVYFKGVSALNDLSKNLVDLHRVKQVLKNKQPVNKQITHNKNLIIASTSDVLELVKKNLMDDNKTKLIEGKKDET